MNQLTQRNKWFFPERNLEVGDLVIIKDDISPPLKWSLGRVIEVYKGNDNLVRVVTLKIGNSHFKRSVDRLIYLPIDAPANSAYIAFCNYEK